MSGSQNPCFVFTSRTREVCSIGTRRNASSAPAIHGRAPIVNIILVLPRIHVAPNALIPRVITKRPLRRACDIDIIASIAMRPSAYVPHFLCRGCFVSSVVGSGICHRDGSCGCRSEHRCAYGCGYREEGCDLSFFSHCTISHSPKVDPIIYTRRMDHTLHEPV